MALIIKGEMPKGKCWWHDEQGKEHECQFFPCTGDADNCPIIGEIPDKHGRLIDADEFITGLRATINKVLLGSLLHNIFVNDESVKQDTLDGINFVLDRLENAPTVLEASE